MRGWHDLCCAHSPLAGASSTFFRKGGRGRLARKEKSVNPERDDE
jgi:hypothetical protein